MNGAAMTGLRELLSDMQFVRDHTTDEEMREFAQDSIDVALDYIAMEEAA
jgi:hypothetical protein